MERRSGNDLYSFLVYQNQNKMADLTKIQKKRKLIWSKLEEKLSYILN
jgi:hypothetical protein